MIRRTVFIFLLLCHSAFGVSAFVQDAGNTLGGPVSSNTQAFTSNNTAGNSIIVFTGFGGGTSDINVCTDTKNNSYAIYVQDAASAGAALGVCVANNIAGGANTVTCKSLKNAYSSFVCYVAEISGTWKVEAVAFKQGTNGSGSSGTTISYNIVTKTAGAFIMAGIWTSGSAGTITPGSGWSHNLSVDFIFQVAGAAGPYNPNWSWGSTTTPVSVAVALTPGTAPAVGASTLLSKHSIVQAYANAASTCVFPRNVTSGNNVIAVASVPLGSTLTGLSDSQTTSYTSGDSSGAQAVSQWWKGTFSSGGPNTITFTGSFSSINVACIELDSSVSTTTVDVFLNGSWEGAPNIQTTLPFATTVNGDTLLCITAGNWGSGLPWPYNPMSFVTGEQGMMIAYQILGAATPASCTFNTSSSFLTGNYFLIALKPSTGIQVTTTAVPTASTGNAYHAAIGAVQGTGTYTFSVSSGTLPTGLSLSSAGLISGTPTGGTKTFSVQVTDGTNTSSPQPLTLTVNGTAATPSFTAAEMTQIGTTITYPSVSIGDVFVDCGQNQNAGGAANVAIPTDGIGTIYHYIGMVSGPPYSTTITEPTTTYCWGGIATSSGTSVVVSFASGIFVPAGIQFRNVQAFFDSNVFTAGPQTTANQTVTSTSLTTPAPNSMSFGLVNFNPGAPSSITAQSPYTDAGSLLADNHIVDLGYNLFSSVSSAAFSSSIVGGSTSAAWNMAMVHLRPSTSGPIAGSVIPRHKTVRF